MSSQTTRHRLSVVSIGLLTVLLVGVLAVWLTGHDEGSAVPGRVNTPNRARTGASTAHGLGTGRLFWGAWIGTQFTGKEPPWDMTAVADFQKITGKGLSLIEFSAPFADCYIKPCTYYYFPTSAFNTIRRYGAIPVFDWGSNAIPIKGTASRFSLSKIINGTYDSYIRTFAREAAAWGHPFFLRFDWEMNGRWFPWGWGAQGNGDTAYVEAWRHVHDIFASAGATNVSWVWCPNTDPKGVFGPIQELYPGSAYVNWTCMDVYNSDQPWTSFAGLFSSTYATIRALAPDKPMLIAETATTEHGGSKSAWITQALTQIPLEFPLVRGIAWFEKYAQGFDWPVETSGSSKRAFRNAIQSSLYVGNQFSSLADGPILPP